MSIKLVDAIFNVLSKDATFMTLLSLTTSSPIADKVKRIIKEEEPDRALTGSDVPRVYILTKPGRYGSNYLVYKGKFTLEIYAKTTYNAKQIAERAFQLLHIRQMDDSTFHTFPCYLAYDSSFATGITGVKGYEAIYDVDYVRTN